MLVRPITKIVAAQRLCQNGVTEDGVKQESIEDENEKDEEENEEEEREEGMTSVGRKSPKMTTKVQKEENAQRQKMYAQFQKRTISFKDQSEANAVALGKARTEFQDSKQK